MDWDLILKILGALGVTAIVSSGFTTFARFILRDWVGDIEALNTKFEEASKLATSIRALAGNPRDGVDISAVADRIQRQALARLVRRLELSDPEYTKAIYPLQGPVGALLLASSPLFFVTPNPTPWIGRLFAAAGIILVVWFAVVGLLRRSRVERRVSSALEAIMPVAPPIDTTTRSANSASSGDTPGRAINPSEAVQSPAREHDSVPDSASTAQNSE